MRSFAHLSRTPSTTTSTPHPPPHPRRSDPSVLTHSISTLPLASLRSLLLERIPPAAAVGAECTSPPALFELVTRWRPRLLPTAHAANASSSTPPSAQEASGAASSTRGATASLGTRSAVVSRLRKSSLSSGSSTDWTEPDSRGTLTWNRRGRARRSRRRWRKSKKSTPELESQRRPPRLLLEEHGWTTTTRKKVRCRRRR